jgi:2-polyprenyl-6-methoxyphenol hydroxylase-like FAD-dependent oxidoreductase
LQFKRFELQEIKRFVDAPVGKFPSIQYSPSVQAIFHNNSIERNETEPLKTCGVLFLGDAAHAFPPDLGQVATINFSLKLVHRHYYSSDLH